MLLVGVFASAQSCGDDFQNVVQDLQYELNTGYIESFNVRGNVIYVELMETEEVYEFSGRELAVIYTAWKNEGGHYTDWEIKCEL